MREGDVRGGVGVGIPEGRLDALADQRVAAVEALGVDPEQDLDRVPGPSATAVAGTPPLSQVDTAACRRS